VAKSVKSRVDKSISTERKIAAAISLAILECTKGNPDLTSYEVVAGIVIYLSRLIATHPGADVGDRLAFAQEVAKSIRARVAYVIAESMSGDGNG